MRGVMELTDTENLVFAIINVRRFTDEAIITRVRELDNELRKTGKLPFIVEMLLKYRPELAQNMQFPNENDPMVL